MIKSIFSISLFLIFFAQINAQNFTKKILEYREKYKSDFLEDTRSPLKEQDLKFLDFYKPDSSYCFNASIEILPNEIPYDMATHSGVTKKYTRYWKLKFELKNKEYCLIAYQSQQLINDSTYKNYLFVPFNDFTNSSTTYGGGRYIDLNIQDATGNKILLDFNKAYNPYCAFAEGYACPIPPAENKLLIEIKAGEKSFLKKEK